MGRYKRIFYYFFIIITLFTFNNIVNAENFATAPFPTTMGTPTVTGSIPINNLWRNYGKGNLIFSFMTINKNISIDTFTQIRGVYVDSNIGFTCKVTGGEPSVVNNTYTQAFYSVDCPIEIGSNGITAVYLDFNETNYDMYWIMSYSMTFVPDSDYSSNKLLEEVNQNIYNFNVDYQNYSNNIKSSVDTGFSNIEYILNQTKTNIDYAFGRQSEELNSQIEQQESMVNEVKDTNTKLQETNDTLKDSDSTEATEDAGSFFSGFTTDTYGLTSIITAPLNLITSITSSTCVPVGLPVPFIDNLTLELPCIRGIYQQHFPTFMEIYQTITFGIVAYWVCIRIFALVKDFKNPEHDEIEVMDL